MKDFAWCWVFAIAACGGSDKSPADAPKPPADAAADASPDAPPDAPGMCNPLAAPGAQGCAAGNKCTWIIVQDTPDTVGKIGCVPDGTVALGGACTKGAAGETTGYDNCVAGAYCMGSTCVDLCGFDGNATSACVQGQACTRYAGLGANGDDDPVIGACNATCDPLTQTRIVNGVTQSCGTGQGCYLLASSTDTIAVCAGAGTVTHNQPIVGTTYANSCAPGHVPRAAVQGMVGNECASLCKPADVYSGMNVAYEGGNSTVLNYAGQPATCESAGGATVAPGVPVTGETCQYYWTREPAPYATNFSNTLGWCFNYASWQYDTDGDMIVDAPYPRCPTLTTGDTVPPLNGMSDALYFGCVANPNLFQGSKKPRAITQPRLDRLRMY